MKEAISVLQEWYSDQCDGDWEHSYGIKVDTLDNPGWILKIDLHETQWEALSIPLVRISNSDQDWMQFEVAQSQYVACGDARKLSQIIEQFISIVWPHRAEPS